LARALDHVAFQQRLSLLLRVKPRARRATCRHCGRIVDRAGNT
jgi:hypothetical protein